MSKSYKPKDGNYIDSTGIVHGHTKLSDILTYSTYEVTDIPAHTGTGDNHIFVTKAGKTVNIVCNPIILDSISANSWTFLGNIPLTLLPNYEPATAGVVTNSFTGDVAGVGRVLVSSTGGLYIKSAVAVTQKTAIAFSISWVLS